MSGSRSQAPSVRLSFNAGYRVDILLGCISIAALLVVWVVHYNNLHRCESCGGRRALSLTGEARSLRYDSLSEWAGDGFHDQEEEFRCAKCGVVVWKKTRKGTGGG